jgi:hypothetical protein
LRSAEAIQFIDWLEEFGNAGNSRINLVQTDRGVSGGTWAHSYGRLDGSLDVR